MVEQSIDILVDQGDELSIARVQQVLQHVASDQSIRFRGKRLKSSQNIVYSMIFKSTNLA
jgi:hypothetical protein